MARIKIKDSTFRETAAVLAVINPNGFRDADAVETYMRQTAIRHAEPQYLGYVSMFGWEMCFWMDEQGEINVRASVMAYTVLRYLKEHKLT